MRNARDSGVSAPKTLVGGVAALALGIVSFIRTNRFRWWQITLIVIATVVAAGLVLAFTLVGLVLFVFRNYP